MPQVLKILFVDDEPDLVPLIQQKFRRLVRSGEIDLVFAGDGVEALEHLDADADIEVVVTDLNMPRMDGLTLLQRLADRGRRHKAVVVTAYGDMENIRTAMNRGAFDFLTKPIDMDDLEVTLGQARAAAEADREADRVRALFGRYLSDEVAEAILSDPAAYEGAGETREVSVLMSDLSGFSQISEHLEPERVVELLNVYLGAMTEVADAHGGTIDEFIGDAVLVLFGAPIAQDDHAQRAVACAVAMQRRMDGVNREMDRLGLPHLRMTAAVNSGRVVVGTIGSEKRSKYAVVGSPVNLTARIQTLAAPGEVLISEATRAAVGEAAVIGETRQASLKGFAAPVDVYSVAAATFAGTTVELDGPDVALELLDDPHAVEVAVLDGKQVDDATVPGRIVALSAYDAELVVEAGVPERADLRLRLSAGPEAYAYAKALAVTPVGGGARVRLRFTVVPEPMARVLDPTPEAVDEVVADEAAPGDAAGGAPADTPAP